MKITLSMQKGIFYVKFSNYFQDFFVIFLYFLHFLKIHIVWTSRCFMLANNRPRLSVRLLVTQYGTYLYLFESKIDCVSRCDSVLLLY